MSAVSSAHECGVNCASGRESCVQSMGVRAKGGFWRGNGRAVGSAEWVVDQVLRKVEGREVVSVCICISVLGSVSLGWGSGGAISGYRMGCDVMVLGRRRGLPEGLDVVVSNLCPGP